MGGVCDKVCFTGEGRFEGLGKGGPDGLRGIVCDLSIDLMEGFGVDLLKGLDENFLKRSLSIIRGNTFGANTLKDAEVRDLSGA